MSSKKCSEVKEKVNGDSEIKFRIFCIFAKQCVRSNPFCKGELLKLWLELLVL